MAMREVSPDPDMIGLISLRASPYQIAQQAIADAAYVCTRTFGDAPQVSYNTFQQLPFFQNEQHQILFICLFCRLLYMGAQIYISLMYQVI